METFEVSEKESLRRRVDELERECCRRTLGQDAQAVRVAELEKERDKLQVFKTWVHNYLDGHGVPHHPPGVHGAEGCRIGDRMDWLMAQLADARGEVEVARGRASALERDLRDADGRAREADSRAAANGARAAELAEDVAMLDTRCTELAQRLQPFAAAYAARLAEIPQAANYPADAMLVMPGVSVGAWRAAHQALEGEEQPE